MGGEWRHGPEASVDFQLETRAFRRAAVEAEAGRSGRIVNFFRYELWIPPAVARERAIAPGHTVVIADMPLAQRRFQTARVQGYAEQPAPFFFEDLEMWPMPPSRAARAALDDNAAIDLLHRLPVNLFPGKRVLSVAIAGTQAGPFVGYDDDEDDVTCIEDAETRARQAAKALLPPIAAPTFGKASYVFGVVASLDAVRTGLWSDPRLVTVWDALGLGTYRLPEVHGGQIVPIEVASRASDHIEVSILQALAGPGTRAADWDGKPVVTRVIDILHEHLSHALDRFDGRSLAGGAG